MTAGSVNELLDLAALQRRIADLADRIGALADSLPGLGRSDQNGSRHIETDDLYHHVVCERGEEIERRSTYDLDELLYWTFAAITFGMACDHEVRNRRAGEDFRRQLFARQVELLGKLSPAWAAREAAEHRSILTQHPFQD